MGEIRRRRNFYAALFAVGALLTIWFFKRPVLEMSFVFGLISTVPLILLVSESRQFSHAKLIWDNRILVVPSATVSSLESATPGNREAKMEKVEVLETVVSTFGILTGAKVYKWGLEGVYGVRLLAVEINRSHIFLVFGDHLETLQVELLHGLNSKQEVTVVQNKLLCETGVEAVVTGW